MMKLWAVLWIGVELTIKITCTNDFQWSSIQKCYAVYSEKKEWVIKTDKGVVTYPKANYVVELLKEE